MAEISTSYATDGITAGLGTYPHPKPVMDTGALVEACRVQARTWVTRAYGVRVPDELPGAGALADLIAEVTDAAWRSRDSVADDANATRYGFAHLDNAYPAALRARLGRGDGYLLGALFSLISAGAALRSGFEDAALMDPFSGHMPVLDDSALIETARVQLNTWAPAVLQTRPYAAGEIKDAPTLSDVIADVLDAAQARYGDMDDDTSIRSMAHLANARAHSLKAGYSHGDAYVFAALGSLVLAAASLA
ncbi:hypothetical protein [Streptomyces sp. NPDC097610]|uniref:hypothetical protein n=1 Tax=Streptomyces sp. NPDC097610 TaxID=3157227 RepID=UPI003321BE7A